MKIKVINLRIAALENEGCNNGNYPQWSGIIAATGEKISGRTCRCLAGCSGQDRLEDYDLFAGVATLVTEEDQ